MKLWLVELAAGSADVFVNWYVAGFVLGIVLAWRWLS